MLISYFRKFYGRHNELVDLYGISVSQMISELYVPYIVTTIPFPFHECDLPNKTIYQFSNNMSNTTGGTCGTGSAYPSGASEITPVFDGVRVA